MAKAKHDAALRALRSFGLAYPGAHTKSPWPGHDDLAVNDKTFAYLSLPGEPLRVSCKLPQSCDAALSLPFVTPAEYGLGKSGWVVARFEDDAEVPLDMLRAWIDESYRAQAPKRLSRGLPPPGALAGSASAEPIVGVVAARGRAKATGNGAPGTAKPASKAKAKAGRKATPRKARAAAPGAERARGKRTTSTPARQAGKASKAASRSGSARKPRAGVTP